MTTMIDYRNEHPVAYRLIVGVCCAVVYFLILYGTLSLSAINGDLLLRPTLGLSPALSLYFGWPAIIGCLIGNDLAQWLNGAGPALMVYMTANNFIYFIIPYLLWYAIFSRSKRPYPRLDSAAKMGTCFGLFILDAIFDGVTCTIFNGPTGLLPVPDDTVFGLYFNNDFLFSMFLGVPLLIVLERSPLVPLPPFWIHVPYHQDSKMSITQKSILMLIIASFFVVPVLVGADYHEAIMGLGSMLAAQEYEILGILLGFMLTQATQYLLIILVLGTIVMAFIERYFALPVERVASASRDFVDQVAAYQASSGENRLVVGDIDVSGMKLTGEISDLVESTNRMRKDIVNYLDELETTTANAERVATELSIAHSIQLGAVPHDFTSFRDRFQLDIATILRPAREVGGDFYDVFDIGSQKVGIIIADVSGKGMPAALFMMRALAETREQMRYRADLGEAMTAANQALCEHNEAMLFVTMFAAVFDATTGQLTYVNAGHNPAWYRSKESGWLKAPPGLVMGVMDGFQYEKHLLLMTPGDGLFFYTDGVTEAINSAQELFGEKRLEEALRNVRLEETPDEPVRAQDVVDAVVVAVDAYAGEEPQFDDITAMTVVWDLPVHTLQLPPDDASLPALFDFVGQFCEGEGRTKRMSFDLNLILEELFVNIAHYGFPEGWVRQPVTIQVSVDEVKQRLYVTLSDAGIPYNPLNYESEKVEPGVEHRVGGLGILLVRELVDDITYERANELNIVHIVKNFV